MASIPVQKSALGKTHENRLKEGMKLLCGAISKGRRKNGIIQSSDASNLLTVVLRECRKKSTTIDASYSIQLAKALEGDDDIGRRIEHSLFGAITHAVLQAEYCIEGERVLYLLARSLLRDENDASTESQLNLVAARKGEIGKVCLIEVLYYFLDKTNSRGMRRWAGILLTQMIRGCELNVDMFQGSGEIPRRGTGQLILDESDEIVKNICGALVRTLVDADVDLEDLWPFGTKKEVYEKFPLSTAEDWAFDFQEYVDYLYAAADKENVDEGPMYPISSLNLGAQINFGAPNYNAIMFFDDLTLSILAPALPSEMEFTLEEIFDVPTKLITRVVIGKRPSQSTSVKLTFELDRSKDIACRLNGRSMDIKNFYIIIKTDSLVLLLEDLPRYQPRLGIIEAEADGETPLENSKEQNLSSQRSIGQRMIVGSPGSNVTHDASENLVMADESSHDLAPLDAVANNNIDKPITPLEPKVNQEPTSKKGSTESDFIDVDPEIPRPKDTKKSSELTHKTTSQLHGQAPRSRNAIKPKAKPPIISKSQKKSNKSMTVHEELSSPLSTVPESKITKSIGKSQLGDVLAQDDEYSTKTKSPRPLEVKGDAQDIQPRAQKIAKQHAKAISEAAIVASKPVSKHNIATAQKLLGGDAHSTSLTDASRMSTSKQSASLVDSDALTTPESNDASTPKPMGPPAKKHEAKPQTIDQRSRVSTQTQKDKTQSNHSVKQVPASPVAVYDLPDNDDYHDSDLGTPAEKKVLKGKGAKRAPASKVAHKSTVSKSVTSRAKPARKSAPVALQTEKPAARQSQRAAANNAKSKIIELAKSEDGYDEQEETSPAKSRPIVSKITAKDAHIKDASLKSDRSTKHADSPKRASAKSVSKSVVESVKDKMFDETTDLDMLNDEQDIAISEVVPELVANINSVGKSSDKAVLTKTQKKEKSRDFDDHDIPEVRETVLDESDENVEVESNRIDDENLYDATPRKSQSNMTKESIATSAVTTTTHVTALMTPRVAPAISKEPAIISSVIRTAEKLNVILQELDENYAIDPGHSDSEAIELEPTIKPLAVNQALEQAEVKKLAVVPSAEIEVELRCTLSKQPAKAPAEQDLVALAVVDLTSPSLHFQADSLPHKTRAIEEDQPEKGQNDLVTPAKLVPTGDSKPLANTEAKVTKSKKEPLEIIPSDVVQHNGKRKSLEEEVVHSKRRKSSELIEEVIALGKATAKEQKSKPSRSKESKKIPGNPLSPRVGVKQTKVISTPMVHKNDLVDDKVVRKPAVIAFNEQGPLNQGRSSVRKSITTPSADVFNQEEPNVSSARKSSGVKRKRDQVDMPHKSNSPSKRRESKSPEIIEEADDNDLADNRSSSPGPQGLDQISLDNEQVQEDGVADRELTPSPEPQIKENQTRPNQASRFSSQSSRVDLNGSPMAAINNDADYTGNPTRKKLMEAFSPSPDTESAKPKADHNRIRTNSNIFGPRISLGAKPKVAPSSSTKDVTARYVAHKEEHGQYTGVASKKSIPKGVKIPDPFARAPQTPTEFTERLRSSAMKAVPVKNQMPIKVTTGESPLKRVNRRQQIPKLPCRSRAAPMNEVRSRDTQGSSLLDPERTLVEREREVINLISEPSDMTNATTDSSFDAVSDVPTANEQWNAAVRPHYNTLHQVVHRIADEVVIRISDEEDRMNLMVNQYRENGTKIVDNLIKKRGLERKAVQSKLNELKQKMSSVYNETKDLVQKNADELRGNRVSQFDKLWRKEQDRVQAMISKGRKISDLK